MHQLLLYRSKCKLFQCNLQCTKRTRYLFIYSNNRQSNIKYWIATKYKLKKVHLDSIRDISYCINPYNSLIFSLLCKRYHISELFVSPIFIRYYISCMTCLLVYLINNGFSDLSLVLS